MRAFLAQGLDGMGWMWPQAIIGWVCLRAEGGWKRNGPHLRWHACMVGHLGCLLRVPKSRAYVLRISGRRASALGEKRG